MLIEAIARFGLEMKLEYCKRPKMVYRNLQQLTRERDQIVSERVVVKNQLHAESSEAEPNFMTLQRINERIKFLNKQEREIKNDITAIIKKEADLKAEIDRMTTIPGVGELTAVIILAETNGFELIRNKSNLPVMLDLMLKKNNQEHPLDPYQKYQKKEIKVLVKQCIFQL